MNTKDFICNKFLVTDSLYFVYAFTLENHSTQLEKIMENNNSLIRKASCTSLAASMLLAACGGADNVATPGSPAPEVPIVQPAWGSMGVLVAPGQESKTFAWPTTCAAGKGDTPLFDASLTIKANGDVSFKAADTAGGVVTERFAIAQSDATQRSLSLNANEGALDDATYRLSVGNYEEPTYKSISLNAGEGEYVQIYNYAVEDGDIRCNDGPVTLASLTPAAAYLPSEKRAADSLLAGVAEVAFHQYDDLSSRIINGVFHWRNDWTMAEEADQPLGSSLNLSNGQLFNGYKYNTSTGLATTPAPIRVTYSAALQSGYYEERHNKATEAVPELRYVQLSLNGETDLTYQLTRIGNFMYVGELQSNE